METMERDAQHIADTLKLLRKVLGLTQENLAELANLSSRTIEKAESGRHCPQEQTLRGIARATGFDVRVFEKPTEFQRKRLEAEIDRAIRKKVFVPTKPVTTPQEFLAAFHEREAYAFDTGAVSGDEAMETAATIVDWLQDLNDVWVDMSRMQRLEAARDIVVQFLAIEQLGYVCHMGEYRQQFVNGGKSPLVFSVGFLSFQPKADAAGERYALVELTDGWESLESDRPQL